jgi:histidyl-tRNA synthetase
LRLAALRVPYTLNPNLVRGLDYYTRTTFEVTSEHLGAQKAVAAGGRYDGLVEEFGGPPTPAIGFAVGMERLVTLLKERSGQQHPGPRVFIATLGDAAEAEGLRQAEALRRNGYWVEPHYGGTSLKSQLRRADRLGADYAVIIGENELASGMVKWKNLKEGTQGETAISGVAGLIRPRPGA